jgi:hypothetical protein
MAISPHVKIRLSPYQLAALEFLSSRAGEHEATWAGHALRHAIDEELRASGLQAAAQHFYEAQLAERAQAELDRLAERQAVPQRARRSRVAV